MKVTREQFLKQKAKVQWLKQGDQNTKFYHNYIKARRDTNRVFVINDKVSTQQTGMEVINKAILDHYSEMLGLAAEGRTHVNSKIIMGGPVINGEHITMLEIKFT